MSSKVIKWFKRQASIRRHSDNKTEEKSSTSDAKSEEKRKSTFPRLSFRKRNKRKGSEIGGGFSIAGISKKFSFSVPKEMESHTKESPLDSRVPTSQSTNFGGSISLTNSPNKTGEYQCVSSETSNQSSFDQSKESTVNESFSLNGKENITSEQNKTGSESVRRASNCDNQQSVSCIPAGSKSNTSLNNFYEDTRKENAPIVKMEEICDSYSDKEHPEETQSNVAFDISNSCKEYFDESAVNNEKNSHVLYDNLNLELVKLKCDETVLYIEEEMDSKTTHAETNIQKEEKQLENVFEEIDRLVKDATSFAELETNGTDSPENFSNDGEISARSNVETEETEVSEEFQQTSDKSNTKTDGDLNNSDTTDPIKEVGMSKEGKENENKVNNKVSENIVNQNRRNSSDDISTLSTDDSSISHLVGNAFNGNDKITIEEQIPLSENNNSIAQGLQEISDNDKAVNQINETSNFNEEIEERTELGSEIHENVINEDLENEIELKITEESDINESESTNLSHNLVPSSIEESSSINKDDENSVTSPVQITFTHPSPVRKKDPQKLREDKTTHSPPNYYPKELNPFGDDDEEKSDSFPEAPNFVPANNDENFEESHKENIRVKENGFSSSRWETLENNLAYRRRMRSSSSSPQLKSSCHDKGQQSKEYYDKSLNPFGESDDDEGGPSSLNSTNPFDEDDDLGSDPRNSSLRETPPRLPPKSVDHQTRKNSRGFLPPIPHPRRSKQSHHGSYTSLQNVPTTTVPIPAPRSITPFGSTKTLNYPLNPFDDEDDDQVGDFRRRGVGRSSLQALPVTSALHEPFTRTGVRGSLPPSKIKLTRKKRPAPLPPGFNQNKPSASLSDFSSLPRKRSSISAFDLSKTERKYSLSSRDQSPQRIPPPRPPPPKYSY